MGRTDRNRVATLSARALALTAVLALAAVGCSSGDQGGGQPAGSGSGSSSSPGSSSSADTSDTADANSFRGTLAPPDSAQDAFTYDPAVAPVGAALGVSVEESENSTMIAFEAEGLLPDRGYAVHAHVNPCGATGDAAGPHFQNRVDPAATPDQPSSDPAYANPENEIWLDLRTDADGSGESSVEVPFAFTDRAPASIVVHAAMATATAPGEAGSAGDRLACLNMPLS